MDCNEEGKRNSIEDYHILVYYFDVYVRATPGKMNLINLFILIPMCTNQYQRIFHLALLGHRSVCLEKSQWCQTTHFAKVRSCVCFICIADMCTTAESIHFFGISIQRSTQQQTIARRKPLFVRNTADTSRKKEH